MPASAVSLELIAAYAGRGELLAVCSTEGGLHPQLALFLGSEVQPVVTGRHGDGGGNDANTSVDGGTHGLATVGDGPDAATVLLKPGFRVILFSTSLQLSRSRIPSAQNAPSVSTSSNASLVFLEDFPNALARIQLIRFGGADFVGSGIGVATGESSVAAGNGLPGAGDKSENRLSSTQKENDDMHSSDDDDDDGASKASERQKDAPIPALVLAGLGLGRAPGFEASMMLDARLQEDLVGAFPSAVGGSQIAESAGALIKAQRQALWYSDQLSTTHEAVVALLSAGPPCFDPPVVEAGGLPDAGIPSGGRRKTTVSDDVEGDQNGILNNLVETIFAYKSTLEKACDILPTSNRPSQMEMAKTARSDARAAHRVASSIIRTLIRMSEMLHAWGLDPALYCPISPGVRCLVNRVVCHAAGGDRRDNEKSEHDEASVERCVLTVLSRSLVARVGWACTWVLPMAVMGGNRNDDFPARGWWEACTVLLADRHDIERGDSSHIDLAHLLGSVSTSATAAPAGGAIGAYLSGTSTGLTGKQTTIRHQSNDSQNNHQTEAELLLTTASIAQGLEQLRCVVSSWLDRDAAERAMVKVDAQDSESEGVDSDVLTQGRAALSPWKWDLGFDTSSWVHDRATWSALEFARRRSRTTYPSSEADGARTKCDKAAAGNNAFFSRLSDAWNTAKEDRSKLTQDQAVAAKQFCQDGVLRRLVLLEATMAGLFTKLPCYVLCQPGLWSDWINSVRTFLCLAEQGVDGSIEGLQSQLSNPPPSFGASIRPTHLRDANVDGTSSTSSGSESSSNSPASSDEGDDGSNFSNSGGASPCRTARVKPRVADAADAADLLVAGDGIADNSSAEPVAGAAPRVRRGSVERIKVKLAHVDVSKGDLSRQKSASPVKEAFNLRATKLFGVSSCIEEADIVGAPSSGNSLASKELKGLAGTTKSYVNTSLDSDKIDGDSEEESGYITFVAESFRPRRDNSDWHREANSAPPPRRSPVRQDASPIISNVVELAMTVASAGTAGERDETAPRSTPPDDVLSSSDSDVEGERMSETAGERSKNSRTRKKRRSSDAHNEAPCAPSAAGAVAVAAAEEQVASVIRPPAWKSLNLRCPKAFTH